MYLLDTNVVSELRNVKTGRANPGVAQWAEQVDAGSLAAPVARRSAGLHGPDPQPLRDGLIAARRAGHSLTVVTRNTADFQASGVRLLNPWQEQAS